MEQFLFVFVHIGIPVLILLALFFHRARTRTGVLFTFLFYTLVLFFLYLWGQWPIAFSLYFKYAVAAILLCNAYCFLRDWKMARRVFPGGLWKAARTILVMLLSALLLLPVFQLLKGRSYDQKPIELDFPLQDGSFYVSSGGSNRVINNHYGTPAAAQWYALDLNKLGKWGMVSNPPLAADNQAHSIFGEPVYAPCDGVVAAAKNTVRDRSEASMEVSPEDGMGNYIIIDCNGIRITMSHLQYKSLKIRKGQSVRAGDPLARVGNSGFSQEPHLHLQAARYAADSTLLAIPMSFNGYAPVRNSVVRN